MSSGAKLQYKKFERAPLLSASYRKHHLDWATAFASRTGTKWRNFTFSDEKNLTWMRRMVYSSIGLT